MLKKRVLVAETIVIIIIIILIYIFSSRTNYDFANDGNYNKHINDKAYENADIIVSTVNSNNEAKKNLDDFGGIIDLNDLQGCRSFDDFDDMCVGGIRFMSDSEFFEAVALIDEADDGRLLVKYETVSKNGVNMLINVG